MKHAHAGKELTPAFTLGSAGGPLQCRAALSYSRGTCSRDSSHGMPPDRMMFQRLSKRIRIRAAVGAAALYAFCVLAPHVALALGNAAHCLTEEHPLAHVHKAGAQAASHAHAGGTAHHHTDTPSAHEKTNSAASDENTGGKAGASSCCGIFCLSAMAAQADAMLTAPLSFELSHAARSDALTGRDPGPLHRPPIS